MPDIVWNDQLLTQQPQMDATHREFVDHLIQVEAALGQPDDVLLPRLGRDRTWTEREVSTAERPPLASLG